MDKKFNKRMKMKKKEEKKERKKEGNYIYLTSLTTKTKVAKAKKVNFDSILGEGGSSFTLCGGVS